jgi:hypothetical protein
MLHRPAPPPESLASTVFFLHLNMPKLSCLGGDVGGDDEGACYCSCFALRSFSSYRALRSFSSYLARAVSASLCCSIFCVSALRNLFPRSCSTFYSSLYYLKTSASLASRCAFKRAAAASSCSLQIHSWESSSASFTSLYTCASAS